MTDSPLVTLRLSEQFRDELDDAAYRMRASRSELVRVMLAYAAETMPALAWHGKWPDIRPSGREYS